MAFARGNIGKAKALASSEDFENVKAEAISLLKYIREMELNEMIAAIMLITAVDLIIIGFIDVNQYADILVQQCTKYTDQ